MDIEHAGQVEADRRRSRRPLRRHTPGRRNPDTRRELAETMRRIRASAEQQHISVDTLAPWMQPTVEGMVECLLAGEARDAEHVIELFRLEREDPERLRELWTKVEQRRRASRQYGLARVPERRRLEVTQRRIAATRWKLRAPCRRRPAPMPARRPSSSRSRESRGRRSGSRSTRAGPAGELPGEGDDGEPSSRRLAVASRSRGGA